MTARTPAAGTSSIYFAAGATTGAAVLLAVADFAFGECVAAAVLNDLAGGLACGGLIGVGFVTVGPSSVCGLRTASPVENCPGPARRGPAIPCIGRPG